MSTNARGRPRILLCGAGSMGTNHLRVLRALSDECEIAGIVDPALVGDDAIAAGVPVFSDVDAANAIGGFDAAIVATPTESHYAVASRLLSRRVPLLIEKPIARTVAEGEALVELAERHSTPCLIGHIERFNPAVVAVRHLIEDGQIGEVIHISTRRVGGRPADVLRAGNLLVDLAVHDIDIVHWLVGELTFRGAVGHYGRVLDSATLVFQGQTSAADIHVNWATPVKIRQMSVTGTKAHVDVNLITQEVTLTRKNPLLAADQRTRNVFFDEYLLSFATPDRIQVGIQRKEPLQAELRAFLAALRADDPRPFIPVSPRDGLRILQLAEQARELLGSLTKLQPSDAPGRTAGLKEP